MAIANATAAQRLAARNLTLKVTAELDQYAQGLQPKAADAGYNTATNTLIDQAITALTAIKNA